MKAKYFVIALLFLSCLISTTWAKGGNGNRGGSTTTLTEEQEAALIYLREEEKLARDVYVALAGELEDGTRIFVNISASEQKHMDSVKQLIDIYGLVDPVVNDAIGEFSNEELAKLYIKLTDKGSLSLIDALEVGVIIEEMDIEDIEMMRDDLGFIQTDVIRVLTNLLAGSHNHLDAFNKSLASQ